MLKSENNKNKYVLIEDTVTINNENLTTYGIKRDATVINDISTDYDFVNYIVKMLNDHDVSEVHMQDVIEDFLC